MTTDNTPIQKPRGNKIHLLFLLLFALISVGVLLFALAPIVGNRTFSYRLANESKKKIIQSYQLVLTTDKQIYKGGEIMKVTADLKNVKQNDLISLHLYGLESKEKHSIVNERIDVVINKDPYRAVFKVNLPLCNSCSGIEPGQHRFYFNVIKNNAVIRNKIFDIELNQ